MVLHDAPSLQEYWDMLNRHDWTYEYSDDHQVWRRGDGNRKKLERIANTSPEHLALYTNMKKYHFSMPSDNITKPERPK